MDGAQEPHPNAGKLRINLVVRSDVDPELYAVLLGMANGGRPKTILSLARQGLKGRPSAEPAMAATAHQVGGVPQAWLQEVDRLKGLVEGLLTRLPPASANSTVAEIHAQPVAVPPATAASDAPQLTPEKIAAISRMASAFP